MKAASFLRAWLLLSLALGIASACRTAGVQSFVEDFNTDHGAIPSAGTLWDGSTMSHTGSQTWVTNAGAGPFGATTNGPVLGVANDGFLELTFARQFCSGPFGSYLCGALNGPYFLPQPIAGFLIECDLRIGNGQLQPDGGLSLNLLRTNDPILLALDNDMLVQMNGMISPHGGQFSDRGAPNDLSLIEEAAQTGLSIGFNLKDSGSYIMPPQPPAVGRVAPGLTQAVAGLHVRVDGMLLAIVPMPTLNGVPTDPTSLETGSYDGTGCDSNLFWCHFKIQLETNGLLNLWWKNAHVLTNFQTFYFPAPGHFLLAAAGQAACANIDLDNIEFYATNQSRSVSVAPPVTILEQPHSLSVLEGSLATFNVLAYGPPPLAYSWRKDGMVLTDGSNISGSTTDTLTLSTASGSDAGNYTVVITTAYGSVTSAPAALTVRPVDVSLALYGGLPGLTVSSAVGKTFAIQYALDLGQPINWITATNLTLAQPSELWMDANPVSSATSRFYRAVPVP